VLLAQFRCLRSESVDSPVLGGEPRQYSGVGLCGLSEYVGLVTGEQRRTNGIHAITPASMVSAKRMLASPTRLLAQNAICLGVDLLLVCGACFAFVLHLGRPSLGISGVTGIRHWVFTLLGQSEVLVWLSVPFRGCKFCHCDSPQEMRARIVPYGSIREWHCEPIGNCASRARRRRASASPLPGRCNSL
jgi:hypothetical protein